MEAPDKAFGWGRSSSELLTKRGESPRLAHTRGHAVATCERRHKKANPPVKIPIVSLCAPLGGLRACTTGGLYGGFMGRSYCESYTARLTRHAQLPLACLHRRKRRQSGSSLAQKTHPRAGLDLSQAPLPTSRICLSVYYSSPHALAASRDPHLAAVFAAPSLLSNPVR